MIIPTNIVEAVRKELKWHKDKIVGICSAHPEDWITIDLAPGPNVLLGALLVAEARNEAGSVVFVKHGVRHEA